MHRIRGPGRFGLLSYENVPVYQPVTPLPGTHLVGVTGMPKPAIGESYEAWEWRMLRRTFAPEELRVHRGLELLDPRFAERLLRLEQQLRKEGIRFFRRETWRSSARQAFLFQRGRARPGSFATATLTSWHNGVDERGQPAGRAADYTVASRDLVRFHEIAAGVGLSSFGADSNDPDHVFLPLRTTPTPNEIALLRLLPRVPHVTLATGRPDGEIVPVGMRPELHASARRFAEEPFAKPPRPRLADPELLRAPWVERIEMVSGPADRH